MFHCSFDLHFSNNEWCWASLHVLFRPSAFFCLFVCFENYLFRSAHFLIGASKVALVVKNPPANAWGVSDVGSIPGLGRFPGGGNGNPLQYSCLENPMDREAWWATVHGAAKSQAQLSNLAHSTYTHFFIGLFVFLLLSRMSCLHTLQMNYLSVPSSANTFSHSVGVFLFCLWFPLPLEVTFYVGLFQRKICST